MAPQIENYMLDKPSPRELEVLRLVAEGLTSREIAQRLGIRFKTVATHRLRLMSKFGVHKSVSLIKAAVRMGFIQV